MPVLVPVTTAVSIPRSPVVRIAALGIPTARGGEGKSRRPSRPDELLRLFTRREEELGVSSAARIFLDDPGPFEIQEEAFHREAGNRPSQELRVAPSFGATVGGLGVAISPKANRPPAVRPALGAQPQGVVPKALQFE